MGGKLKWQQAEGVFIVETFTEAVTWHFTVERMLAVGRSKFQDYQIVDLPVFGKTLFLDYRIQSSLLDEYVYHEGMVQPAMTVHPDPKKVLVCGGGEGATLWQALQHDTVKEAHMVDLDEELIGFVKEHMEEWHQGAFDDPRTTLVHQDARKWVEDHKGYGYDVILSDLPGPVEGGPALYLYTEEYFRHVHDALGEDGVFVLQSGAVSETYPQCFACVHKTLSSLSDLFPVVRGYWAGVTTFMTNWGFIIASKRHDPLALTQEEIARRHAQRGVQTRYYTPRFHPAMFTLPEHMLRDIGRFGRVLTDAEPFVWQA